MLGRANIRPRLACSSGFPTKDLRFEATTDVAQYAAIQAIRDRDVLVVPADDGPRYLMFRGVPIEIAA
jgi:hypothetical protein